ncbi:Chitin synthase, class 7 [Orbilia oligospora]|uniref:Chitin synthase export chaperone n=1 Tax=Arthrobotrys oligospora (strain ATCC 24927 / CBS 115.81 / DSM 1491) TaxID=756982 RepID=G1WYY8_ARTOA|nr:hypothetical protein AOL_s00004g499 [Orbilia oligospora ATCC 24927]EGX53840.1 hypothetical protein AOL_s00004g499 [Orbilia oligospora ATCC 24927]KAF3314859.1 Chitin synthase, class 7 [Orbilia oligospora]
MGFGDFDQICSKVSLPLCSLIGPYGQKSTIATIGIEAECYSRSIELANTIIFQGASDFIHIVSLIMTAIMLIHVRSKFTAVGRKEITTFFYLFMGLTAVSLCLDAGVIPVGSQVYLYFVAVQSGMISALCWCLMINGFVGFQLYEDGTRLSIWLLRLSSVLMFLITGAVALATFKGWAGLGPTKTIGLFVVLYILNAVFLVIYIASQILLVLNTLQDRWPLGDILFGILFFVVGQVLLYALSDKICNSVNHYLDGVFFATICNLLGVMMVYKYWDSITKEDLEFSVASQNFEVKEPLMDEAKFHSTYEPEFHPPGTRSSAYQYY